MASICNLPNGRRMIQVVCRDGKRRSIRLGKVSQDIAEDFKAKIEKLAHTRKLGIPLDAEVDSWLCSLSDEVTEKLEKAGLTGGECEYELNWNGRRGEQGVWRKAYKGTRYEYKRLPGETKRQSYQRCLVLFRADQAKANQSAGNSELSQFSVQILRDACECLSFHGEHQMASDLRTAVTELLKGVSE